MIFLVIRNQNSVSEFRKSHVIDITSLVVVVAFMMAEQRASGVGGEKVSVLWETKSQSLRRSKPRTHLVQVVAPQTTAHRVDNSSAPVNGLVLLPSASQQSISVSSFLNNFTMTVFESVVTVLQIERIHARESLTPKRIIIRLLKQKRNSSVLPTQIKDIDTRMRRAPSVCKEGGICSASRKRISRASILLLLSSNIVER